MISRASRAAPPTRWFEHKLERLGLQAPPALLAALAIASWAVWMSFDGGHPPTLWAPIGSFLIVLLGLGLVFLRSELLPIRGVRAVGLIALSTFVAWNYLSMLWADFPADAWTGADKSLLYGVSFAIFALWRVSRATAATLLGIFVLAVALVAVVWLCRAVVARDPGEFFEDGRAIGPTGYVNASVALWMMGAWPATYLAARRGMPAVLRGAALACAALFMQLALLGQSRAWLALLPIVVAVSLLASRQRMRTILALGIVALSAAATLDRVLDVLDSWENAVPMAAPVRSAAIAMLLSCAAVAVAGIAWALVDDRIRLSSATHRRVATTVATVALLAAGAGGAGAIRAVDDPRGWLSARWDSFTCPYCPSAHQGSRFTGTLSNDRYREWTIAWNQFKAHPIIGAGSDNYLATYLEQRTDDLYEPLYPHSTPLRLLGQLGLVGTFLFLIAGGAAIALALQNRKRVDPIAGGAVGAAVTVFAYWLFHGSVDWLWEMPAVAAPAFGLLGLATAIEPSAENAHATNASPGRSRDSRPLFVLAVVVGVAVVALPGLSYAYANAGVGVWRQDTGLAYRHLERAADLNPLGTRALLLEAAIASRRGNQPLAQHLYMAALEREPRNWYADLQLALLFESAGKFDEAARYVARARALNPRDRVAAIADRLIRRRFSIDPNALNALFLKKEQARFFRPAIEPQELRIGRVVRAGTTRP